jgi:hypothetical protein
MLTLIEPRVTRDRGTLFPGESRDRNLRVMELVSYGGLVAGILGLGMRTPAVTLVQAASVPLGFCLSAEAAMDKKAAMEADPTLDPALPATKYVTPRRGVVSGTIFDKSVERSEHPVMAVASGVKTIALTALSLGSFLRIL